MRHYREYPNADYLGRRMKRTLEFAYGAVAYLMFLGVFLYLLGFCLDLFVPKSAETGVAGPVAPALLINSLLLLLFGVQHSVMARRSFKDWITQFISPAIERSTYVLATNLAFILMFVYWQPLPGSLWSVEDASLRTLVYAIAGVGTVIILISTFLTDHFDLFGLRQIWLNLLKKTYTPVPFQEIFFYKWVRHPMMVGVLILLWAAPDMSMGHLMFSAGMSLYILVGIHFEEKGLARELGEPYTSYQARTRRLLPFY